MTDTSENIDTLILGGTGKTGRRIADALTTAGRPVRLGSRSAAIPFDWTDRGTWAPAGWCCCPDAASPKPSVPSRW